MTRVSGARIITSGKMTAGEYSTLHHWVRSKLGKPQECENCGTVEKRCYDWANLSGEYKKDISDWARLCRLCHALIDGKNKTHCNQGHKLEGDNVRYRVKNGIWQRFCRVCKYNWVKAYQEKQRLLRQSQERTTNDQQS